MIARSLTRTAVVGTCATVVVGGLIAASPAGAATPAAVTQASCSTGRLPTAVLGDPKVRAGQSAGAYLAHGTGAASERTGYALAVTHPGSRPVVFTGTVTSSAPITYVKVRDERHDAVRLSADHKTLTYRFVNYGGIDGVAFRADCARTVTFNAALNYRKLPASQVFLGAQRVHPSSVPFTVERS
jgi:hypothetical protein